MIRAYVLRARWRNQSDPYEVLGHLEPCLALTVLPVVPILTTQDTHMEPAKAVSSGAVRAD